MYQSSNGELKDVTQMETTYLTNALNKAHREIWNSQTEAQYKIYKNNIEILREELDKRIEKFNMNQNGGVHL